MSNKIDYGEVLTRMGFFRTQSKLSQREISLRLGYAENFMKRIESKELELKMRVFLEFLDIVDKTPQDFFYLGEQFSDDDKSLLILFSQLTQDNYC